MADPGQDIPGGFEVDLGALSAAISSVTAEQTNISGSLDEIRLKMNGLPESWNSPAYSSFDEVRAWFGTASTSVLDLLGDLIVRMQTSYDNYAEAEGTNVGNLTT
ncbi:hypothetical protein E1293_18605 [Actinomadura darangshiensis]|uniref:WXG100 family type VII secretion target n=1 Tax=Actinomadura darangshiensis TaxID=705336 RepID=A0A4R5B5H0_9ACTN|nr:hypothetical protein [Actinomadura darangshiensis]TDD81478.1 hypothetical protein E1293_18605 [Actinomadura darangshiensis]